MSGQRAPQTIPLLTRVTLEFRDAIAALAAANDRTISAEIRIALKAHLKGGGPIHDLDPLEHLLTLDESAALLGISRRTVRRHIDAGDIRVVRIGSSVRVAPSELRRFLS